LLLATVRQLAASRRPTCHPDVWVPGVRGRIRRHALVERHVFSLHVSDLFKHRTLGSITFALVASPALDEEEWRSSKISPPGDVTIGATLHRRAGMANTARDGPAAGGDSTEPSDFSRESHGSHADERRHRHDYFLPVP
jgi:hypothetical protein